MAGKVKIDPERCKGCGLCVEVCPRQSLTLSSQETNRKGYFFAEPCAPGCTGCAICALICPEAAIEVYRDTTDAQPQNNRPTEPVKEGTP